MHMMNIKIFKKNYRQQRKKEKKENRSEQDFVNFLFEGFLITKSCEAYKVILEINETAAQLHCNSNHCHRGVLNCRNKPVVRALFRDSFVAITKCLQNNNKMYHR